MNQIDELIRSVGADAPLADRSEQDAMDAARRTLRAAIAAEQRGRRRPSRRRGLIALFAVLAITGISVPAFGVASGWFSGGGEIEGIRGSAPPQLTSAPVVVASGEPGEAWTIWIARSNQGLCLNVDVGNEQFDPGNYRLGDCGYSDIHGELPTDVRGDPSAPCIGPPSSGTLVPCGSRPKYWVTNSMRAAGVFVPDARQSIFLGAAAARVASVELVLANGETLRANVVERPLGPDVPLSVYWAELGPEHGLEVARRSRDAEGNLMACNGGELVQEVVARDGEGNVLGNRVPAWNGNPTGDPDGPRPPEPLEMDPCL
jgi:hypothetical protein